MTETGAKRELSYTLCLQKGGPQPTLESQGELIPTEPELWIGTWQVGSSGHYIILLWEQAGEVSI